MLKANVVNLHDFGTGNYKQIDDYVFGSGGMLLAAPQLKEALDSVLKPGGEKNYFVAYPSPQGVLLNHEVVESLALQENLVIICGRYEGIDERFTAKYVDLEFSVGDCVLTGGEIPAMALIDAVSRLIPGVIGKNKAVVEDSFYRGMLDNPNYTRPVSWEGLDVPEILLSGNENEILKWRRSEAVKRTLIRRPDLISRASIRDYLTGGIYLAVIKNNADMQNFNSQVLNNLENLCNAFEIGRPFFIAHNHETREALKNSGTNAKILGSVNKVLSKINDLNSDTLIIKISAFKTKNALQSLEAKRRILEHSGAVLLLFAGDRESENELNQISGLTAYIFDSECEEFSGISLDNLAAMTFDRFLGRR